MTMPTKIPLHKISQDHIGHSITTFGWIESIRSQGRAGTFIDLYHNFKTIKCLSSKIENLTPHSSIYITGDVKPNFSKKDKHEFEIHITDLTVYKIAPSFPINEKSSTHTLLELGHLNLRTKERILFLKARNELQHLIRDFYYKNEYCEIVPPTLVQTQVEGGSTLFHLKYYKEDAYLTQSSQLYLETVIASTGKAYCIMPSYRAEKFNTTRHLSEYTHVEAELGDICFNELMDEIEKLVKFVINEFYKKMGDEIKELYPEVKCEQVSLDKFKRITYEEAINVLRENKVFKDKESEVLYEFGNDISDRDEIQLVEILGGNPVFLTNFPVEHKAFYCRKSGLAGDDEKAQSLDLSELKNDLEKNNLDEKILNEKKSIEKKSTESCDLNEKRSTESCDLLWPGIGEILGGSMRAEKYEELMEGFKREEIDASKYNWYTDLRLFGASRHGGYGLGFERFMRGLMKYDTVNKACLYPRFPGRCQP